MKTLWRKHGTKVLGYVQMVLPGLLAIEGLVPPAHLKYWLALGVLLGGATVMRGHENAKVNGARP